MKLQLSYPVNSQADGQVIINQPFGANPGFYSDPKYGGIKGHNGLDFFAGHGTPIYATHDGLASYQIDSGGGHGIVILTEKDYDGIFYKTIYWHLIDGLKEPKYKSPLQGKAGYTKVLNGELIGYADNTGASTGDHLHFGLKPVARGESWWVWDNIEQQNGYNGAIDPMPFFDTSTPATIQNLTKQVSILQMIEKLLKEWISILKRPK